MKNLRGTAGWAAAIVAIMLSPIALVFAVPLLINAGLDITDVASMRLVALFVWAPIGIVLLRRVLRRMPRFPGQASDQSLTGRNFA